MLLRCQENRGGSKPAAASSSLPRGARRASVALATSVKPKAPAAGAADALSLGSTGTGNRRHSQLVGESQVASFLSSASSVPVPLLLPLPVPDFEGTEEDMVRSDSLLMSV